MLAYSLGDTDPLRVLPSEGDAALDLAAEGVVLLVEVDDGLGMMMACCAVVLFTVEAALMGDRPTDEKGAAGRLLLETTLLLLTGGLSLLTSLEALWGRFTVGG